jgi:hypothetical protein
MKTAPFKKVISASRRLDLLAFFPDRLRDFLTRRCPPEKTHSVVLWSKNPSPLAADPALRRTLERYDQLFLHWTLTGMGASRLEPRVPSLSDSLGMLESVKKILGSPRRIRVRFDPIVHLRMRDGSAYSNLGQFVRVAEAARRAGIEDMIVSWMDPYWMDPYPKAVHRLRRHGFVPEAVSRERWSEESGWLIREGERIGMRLTGCCVPGLPGSSCIDGRVLSRLHPRGEPCSALRAKGQRALCGCTESWDIGWYLPCPGGCLYCYARPSESGEPGFTGPAAEISGSGDEPRSVPDPRAFS